MSSATIGSPRRLAAAILVLLVGVLVVVPVADTGVAAADACETSKKSTSNPGVGSSHSLARGCPQSNGSSAPGRAAPANLDPNREVCFYRPSRGGGYATADAPAGQTAADGRSMDRYCGKASDIAAARGAGDPMDVCKACGAVYGVWVPNAAAPTPQEVATSLLATLNLTAPATIHTSPDADRRLVVSLPTWLWIDGNDRPETASDGPISITARPTVRWWTSEGAVPCAGPGTPYEHGKSEPEAPSPTCGWTFTTIGPHTISATVTWEIAVGGAPGVTFPDDVFTVVRDVRVEAIRTVNR